MHTSIKPITEKYLLNFGLYYLKRFPTTKNNFKNILKQKIELSCNTYKDQSLEKCYEMMEHLIENMVARGYLNDEMYLEATLHSFKSKGLSSKMIHFKLAQKGVCKKTIDEAIGPYGNEEELVSMVRMMKRKKLGAYSKDTTPEDIQKHKGYLQRNGFDLDTIQKGIKLSIDECQEILDSF
jgi:SOS response regulatory protein OraA/RecX